MRADYFATDTIAAWITGGSGAVQVARVSGAGAFTAVDGLIGSEDTACADREPGYLTRVRVVDPDRGGAEVDHAMLVVFRGPRSFTGEDVVELHLHGGGWIRERAMEILLKQGVRPALPGEFSFRAVRNGKMDLTQAEAVRDLVSADSGEAARLALEKLSGGQRELFREISDLLRESLMLAEAGIDFSDQDIDEVSVPVIQEKVRDVVLRLKRISDSFARGNRIQEGIRVTLVGLPNAGKSSLFNAFAGTDRAIVTPIAGTTRDVLREKVTLRAVGLGEATFIFSDSAGLRDAADEVEKIGVARALREAREGDLILFVVDGRSRNADMEERIFSDLNVDPARVVGVRTKKDLGTQSKHESVELSKIGKWFDVSSQTLEGIQDLVAELVKRGCELTPRSAGEILLTRIEHKDAVERALGHLGQALDAQDGENDRLSAELRFALVELGPLIGAFPTEEILGMIFSRFCIGK